MGGSPVQLAAQRLVVRNGGAAQAANAWARRPCHVSTAPLVALVELPRKRLDMPPALRAVLEALEQMLPDAVDAVEPAADPAGDRGDRVGIVAERDGAREYGCIV